MAKTLIAFFSRADENYFGGAMRYVKVGNTEIAVNLMKDMISADTFKIEMKNPYSPVYMTCIDEAKRICVTMQDLSLPACPKILMNTTLLFWAIRITGELCRWQYSLSLKRLTFREKQFFRSAQMRAVAWAEVSVTLKTSVKQKLQRVCP